MSNKPSFDAAADHSSTTIITPSSSSGGDKSNSQSSSSLFSTSTAPSSILSEACATSLQSFLEQYQKKDWHDFSTAGRSHVALAIAKEHVFKPILEIFKKDNPNASKEPLYKTIPDYFGYGVKCKLSKFKRSRNVFYIIIIN